MDKDAVRFLREFFAAGKPVGAICHAPWMLVEADVVDGRKVTSFPSIQTDIQNAGGNWVDADHRGGQRDQRMRAAQARATAVRRRIPRSPIAVVKLPMWLLTNPNETPVSGSPQPPLPPKP